MAKNNIKVVILLGFFLILAIAALTRSGYEVKSERAETTAPAGQPAAAASPKPAVNMDCAGCHGAGRSLPVLGPGEKFHKSEHASLEASVHAKADASGKPNATCADCHTSGGDMTTVLPFTDPASTMNAAKQAETCGSCHTEATQTFHDSIHGGLIEKGELKAASCSDCHGSHDIRAVKDPASQLSRESLAQMCVKCHSTIVPAFESSSHGAALREGKENAPSCTECHTAVSHNRAPDSTRDFSLQMIDKCSSCHQQQAPSYRDTFHGQATAFGYKPSATCADCHTPHNNLPAKDPRSSVNPANLTQTCASCHTNANPSFATYNPHPEPTDPSKGFWTYLINTFMKWLLFGVFTFFGIHTVLWLQRSLVSVISGDHKKRIREEEDQWVVRFAPKHRFTHLLIIISFLGLAATGLPLMYSFTDWGQWLVRMHGGLGVTRYLHRVCAIITVVYALYHFWFIAKKALIERDWSAFWGPESMTIRKQDLIDVFKMFRWFLYLGPKPKLDRFTYWEKFDYFAVFWGVPVIGLSGLMLWFPTFFTKFLPGEALNIAMIVHSEEALLATAFIFAFHFFHSHLRPENFPMDLVMFTGKMRLSWFKEERPHEYARLVREGRLDSLIVPPPSKTFRFFARIFGFVAYITGLVLVIWIFVTLLTSRH